MKIRPDKLFNPIVDNALAAFILKSLQWKQ